ncbi:SSS family solute:Na+ symporter [Saccharopolyspora erythraea NRRL 2338]|uniref:Sodium:proline symporter n=4 Tax=Saccharopolyspora erythraea TaxID=1836 RepID=A4FDW5_SACEN|nr:sodium:solute symporter family protein [Saccharopolyspora erythraea]PFG95970.1 SSS family solute:Na+ symporter [Saccharopolyspora erythraea NRRL 2338]QRK92534.1 sodium:solute symporter family protein [Saccharopolyspora erythraea]CAM02240.1 sodium:proline symporter [Saccharopolyspora erythraea NRRL 2338]
MPTGSTGQIAGIIIASLLVIGFGVAMSVYFGRRAKSSEDWLSAGESLPLVVVVITQFATATGGGVLIAHVGIGYRSGWSVFIYEGCVLVGFLVLMLIAKWLREQRFTTVPDIVTRLFGEHKLVTAIAALAALVVPFGWLATQFVAFAQLFGQLTGLPATVLIAVIMVASLLFVLPGGLTSVAWTDFVFGVFMIAMSLGVATYAVSLAGGWGHITATVPQRLWGWEGLTAVGWDQIWLWVAAILPGTLTNQLYYQRVFATKKVSDARRGLGLSGLTMLIGGVYAGCIGLAVHSMNPGLANEEDAAGWLLTRLPSWLLVVFGAFLVSTIVSTTGAALQSVVANLTRDVYQNIAGRAQDERQAVRLSRAITVAVSMLAAVLAILFPKALTWLVATYAYSAAALAAPIFLGYLLHRRRRLTPAAAITGMLAGLTGCAVAQVLDTTVPYAVYGIAASAVVLLAVAFATPGGRTENVYGEMVRKA